MAHLFYANMTRKGQVTVPKKVRDVIGASGVGKIVFQVHGDSHSVSMSAATDFLDIADRVSKTMRSRAQRAKRV